MHTAMTVAYWLAFITLLAMNFPPIAAAFVRRADRWAIPGVVALVAVCVGLAVAMHATDPCTLKVRDGIGWTCVAKAAP
jgi:hypothetical protein